MATVSQTEAGQEKCKITKEAGTKIMGTKKLQKKHKDTTLETLSKKHPKFNNGIEACTDNNIRSNKLIEKKYIKKQLQKRVKEIEEQELNSNLDKIENMKDDSNRYYTAIKELADQKRVYV